MEHLREGTLELSNRTADRALIQKVPGDSSLYAGDTILDDVPSFEQIGRDTGPFSLTSPEFRLYSAPISPPESFMPRIFSSPVTDVTDG